MAPYNTPQAIRPLEKTICDFAYSNGYDPISVFNDFLRYICLLYTSHTHCVKEIRLPEEDYDPVWVIWFGKNGEPYECRVTGLRVTADSLTVLAEEKESGDEVECYSPFELGASNIDWLSGMYEAVWQQLEESKVEPQTEEQ